MQRNNEWLQNYRQVSLIKAELSFWVNRPAQYRKVLLDRVLQIQLCLSNPAVFALSYYYRQRLQSYRCCNSFSGRLWYILSLDTYLYKSNVKKGKVPAPLPGQKPTNLTKKPNFWI